DHLDARVGRGDTLRRQERSELLEFKWPQREWKFAEGLAAAREDAETAARHGAESFHESDVRAERIRLRDSFRTNIGLVEGFGTVASGRLRVFTSGGQSLGEFPFSLRPFEFQQLGSFLASKGVSATDARIEVV